MDTRPYCTCTCRSELGEFPRRGEVRLEDDCDELASSRARLSRPARLRLPPPSPPPTPPPSPRATASMASNSRSCLAINPSSARSDVTWVPVGDGASNLRIAVAFCSASTDSIIIFCLIESILSLAANSSRSCVVVPPVSPSAPAPSLPP